MKLSNKWYDRIKWVAILFIPALATLILTVGKIWSLPYYDNIAATVTAFGVFLAAILGISTAAYYKAVNKNDFIEALKENNIPVLDEDTIDGIGGSYTPRLKAPSRNDKNWIWYGRGGYNYCILISGNSCLPNCVGYAWGRWRELLGKKPKLSLNNAEDWWAKNDGYKRGQEPALGAVACWRKGKAGNGADGAGHVAVVEKIDANGIITLSNSAYGGKRFYLTKFKKGKMDLGSKYYFQGFIYLPNTEPKSTPKKDTKKSTSKTVTYTVKRGDTLSGIASKYGTTYKKIAKDNGIENPNFIRVGQKLKIKL